MGKIDIVKNAGGIEGLFVITPVLHGDERGNFSETYSFRDLEEAGIETVFKQDNQAMSTKGILRGLHFQKEHSQAKLLRVIRGEVFDVAVDLRKDSKTCGRWYGETLSAENRRQMFVPKGFAHGYLVLSDEAEICYKCDDYYHPEDEGGVLWNDPEIGIIWPKTDEPVKMNERDRNWPCLREVLEKGYFGKTE